MLTIENKISQEEINAISNFFDAYENELTFVSSEESQETVISKYVSTLVTGYYQKSVQDISDTKVGNRIVKKRNLQQIMRESFFYGANRFGNNFIA